MSVLFRFLVQLFARNNVSRQAPRKHSLAFEPLRRRDMLAADLAPYDADGAVEAVEIANERVDDVMFGGIDGPGTLAPVDGGKINVKRYDSGLSGLDSLEQYSASYGGYGGDTPDLSDVDVQFDSGTYDVSGFISDDNTTDATITINGVTVDANAASDGSFSVQIDGQFHEQVEVIVTDLDGNTDSEIVSAD